MFTYLGETGVNKANLINDDDDFFLWYFAFSIKLNFCLNVCYVLLACTANEHIYKLYKNKKDFYKCNDID